MQDGTFSKPGHPEVSEEPEPHREQDKRFTVNEDCGMVSDILSRIGDKWSVLVVSLLGNGTMRFSELRRELGTISQKMLTTTLRNLERDGFVERTVHPTVPPKVEYSLTDLGRKLLCPVRELGRWAQTYKGDIQQARAEFDRQQAAQ